MRECKLFGIYNLSILWLILTSISELHCGYNEKRLIRSLFDPNKSDAHNIFERPSKNDSLPLEVRMKTYFTQLIELDEKNQILHSNIWLELTWRDYHFIWNPAEYGGVSQINVPAEKVWKPDILLFNGAGDQFDSTYPVNVIITNNSLMRWFPPGRLKSTCDIDITWFPFDVQSCTLEFGSWTFSGRYIDLKLKCPYDDYNEKTGNCTESSMLDLDAYVKNGEFYILNSPIYRIQYAYNKEIYVKVLMTIRMKRKYLYYIFNLIMPCVLISAMALLEFALPPDAGEKISLGVTILLSMTMFLFLVADKLPQTSGGIPLICIYFACIMIMCTFSIVFTVLVLNYHHRSLNLEPISPLIKLIINTWLAKLLFMKQYKDIKKDSMSAQQENVNNQRNGERFSINSDGRSNDNCRIPKSASYMNLLVSENLGPIKIDKPSWSSNNSRHELTVIINELKKITEKIKNDEEEISMAQDWKFAARVIDRCCLMVFSLFTIISTLAVLTRGPKSEKILA